MSTTTNTNRRNPRRVGLRRQAAPTIDIDIASDQVDDLQRELAEFPDLREIMAYNGNSTGVDNNYGPRTFRAIALIAREANISEADITRINFREKTGDLYTRWHAALQNHHKENETPRQVVARVEQVQALTPEQIAAANEAARRAAEAAAAAAAREEANNRVPASIRGTQYDPRHLATLSTPDLINIAKDGLHGIGEISRGFLGTGSYHRNGRLGPVTNAKLLEHAREANIIPRDQDTLTRRELEATVASLGEAVVRRNGFALAQLPPETNPMNAPAPAPTGALAATTATTATAATNATQTNNPLPDAVRAQADSVRGGLQSNARDGEPLLVGGDNRRQRDDRTRIEGGEQVDGNDGPNVRDERLQPQELIDRRRPIRIV